MLARHSLHKTTVDWPPCPPSPEEKGENAARLLWSVSSRGQRAEDISQQWGMHKVARAL